MNKAECFIKHNLPAEKEAQYAIEKLNRVIRWKDDCKILDVGCGTGNVTHDFLLPVLPKSTKSVIGIDNEKSSIEYATNNYALEDKLRFEHVDIVYDDDFFENYAEHFDHIFSFSCLHFVREQETALRNIRGMLKPGGDFNFCCVVACDFFSVIAHLATLEKWQPYIAHYENYMSPFQFTQNPMEQLKIILIKVGFRIKSLTIESKSFKMPFAACPGLFVSHIPMEIPSELEHEFGLSSLEAIRELNFSSVDEKNEEHFNIYFDSIVGHVTKLT